MDIKVQENFNCVNLEQTLVTKSEINETLVTKSEINENLVTKSEIDETLVFESAIAETLVTKPEINETLVTESEIDKYLVTESEFDKTLVSETAIDETVVTKPEIYETLVTELKIDKTMDSESAIDETLGHEPEIDQTLADEQLRNQSLDVELERGSERGCDETSSNSSFKLIGAADADEALAEDEANMYHEAQTLVEVDDVDYDAECDSEMRRGCDMWRGSGRLGWVSTWGGSGKKEDGNSFSWFNSDLDEVNSAMVGAGLYNLGNTCFLNAILQCFTHTVPLIEGLRSYNHPNLCERDSEGFCVFCALHNHIEVAITSMGKSLSPLKIVENLNQLSSGFQRYQQEDAHELLQCLLDKLDICCNSSKTDDSDGSLVHRLFGGRLVSKLKCCNCGHCSDTLESLIDLSLEIENASSLANALESFTKVEKIEDEEPQFTCENCKEKVTVEKQLMVDHAPTIAAFHLKRFKNDGSRVEKIDTHVEFPLELDLKPYTSGGQNDNEDLKYSLYAIVVHSGFSPTSGHYFCFVRAAPDVWYRLDDSLVSRVSETHVLSRDAYILLYAKNGTPWFSTFMETEKLSMDSYVSNTSPKSVLENAKQTSESSLIMETNIIGEMSEEDRMEATAISGASFNSSRHKGENGATKIGSKIEEKLLPSTFGGDSLVVSSTSPKSITDNRNHISKSSPLMEINISCDVDEEDRDDAMEISKLSFDNSGHINGVDRAKSDTKVETSSSSPALRGDNSNHKDEKLTKFAFLKPLTSQRSSSPIRVSKLCFNDCELEDTVDDAKDGSKVEKKLSPCTFRSEVVKGPGVKSTIITAKPCSIPRDPVITARELPCKRQSSDDVGRKLACKQLKSMPCSKRRLNLLAAVNSDIEVGLNNKKTKVNKMSSNMKNGPSNALHPNFVSLRRPVAPGRF